MSVLISHGDKGGVGKSLVICAYVDYRMNQEGFNPEKLVVLDADPRNADVFRMYDGYLPHVERISLSAKEDWMKFVDRIQSDKDNGYDYIISMPAGIGTIMSKEGSKFGDYVEMLGHEITMFWTIDRMPDSVNLLKRAMFDIGSKIKQMILVKNQFFGASDSFTRWDSSYLRKLFLLGGGIEANLPELHEWVIDEVIGNQLDEDDVKQILLKQGAINASEAASSGTHRTIPFSALLDRTDLRLTLRGEMEEWLRKVDSFFAEIDQQVQVKNLKAAPAAQPKNAKRTSP
ncbi:MAG: hypothetical protein ACYCTY_13860 [Sulfuricella sp.]